MGVIGRAFLILFALCCAFSVGALTLGFAALAEPAFGRMISLAARSLINYAFSSALAYDDPRAAFELLMRMWTVLAIVLAGPPTLIGLIGEIARVRSFIWYSGATGLLTAALPWAARTGYSADPLSGNWGEGRVTLALFLCGAMAGLAYWLVAGRSAGGGPDQRAREIAPGAGTPTAP
ncbi:hypothetical protein GCM10019059_14190 [Camelimonas fluminis]|uniref:Uncharacterized protein n=1 Tax=Camelimonas fluminis TaxID=1576911 RepID=A0ABV7UKP4_9HYPH|nr:hypothetical protein [Camelimonas fluminis]GHE55887.1 hypothetical protein GCM10019059_14190 [Camelimonas fluminis]